MDNKKVRINLVKDFMRTNLPGIDGRVTLYEIEDINFNSQEISNNQIISLAIAVKMIQFL